MKRMTALAVACGLITAGWLGLPYIESALAAPVVWDVEMKGTSKTFDRQKFPFTGVGTMTWDQDTGDVSFDMDVDPSGPFDGDGTLVVISNGKTVYGVVTFNAGVQEAQAIFTGKLKKNGQKFAGKFTAASPGRLGPPPGGFVLTTGKVKAEPQAP